MAGAAGATGGAVTSSDALAAGPAPASTELTALVVLVCVPSAAALTATLNAQLALGASAAPASAIDPEPAAAVTVPPGHEPVNAPGVATTRPPDSVAVKPIPLSASNGFVFASVNVWAVVAPSATDGAANADTSAGGASTTSVSVAPGAVAARRSPPPES